MYLNKSSSFPRLKTLMLPAASDPVSIAALTATVSNAVGRHLKSIVKTLSTNRVGWGARRCQAESPMTDTAPTRHQKPRRLSCFCGRITRGGNPFVVPFRVRFHPTSSTNKRCYVIQVQPSICDARRGQAVGHRSQGTRCSGNDGESCAGQPQRSLHKTCFAGMALFQYMSIFRTSSIIW